MEVCLPLLSFRLLVYFHSFRVALLVVGQSIDAKDSEPLFDAHIL